MTSAVPRARPRPRSLRSGAFFIVLAALLAAGTPPAAAQEPDTARVVQEPGDRPPPMQDSLRGDTVDTLPPPPPAGLPALHGLGPEGWSRGVWEWDRDDLLRLPDLSLLQLLERIPGLVPVRADILNQPESGAVFGAAAGAIRYVVDGFTLDPLTSPTFDPSRLALLALDRVRVERRVTGATVRVETLTPDDGRTKSVIEAGTGDYDVNLFRGIFLAPRVLGGSLGAGFERLSADGFRGTPSNHNVTWLKWTLARDSSGVQLEYRRSTVDRQGVGQAVVGSRSDWAVRARTLLGPLTGEAYVGATAVEDELGGAGGVTLREGTPQGGVRLATAFGPAVPVEGRLAVRFRGHPRLPSQEAEAGVRLTPVPWLGLEGEAVQGWWAARGPTGRWATRAVLGPLLGVRAFAELSRGGALGEPGAELTIPAPADSVTFGVTRDGARAGVELGWGSLALGGAVVQVESDRIQGFGLPSEPGWVELSAPRARGYEVTARIPTGVEPLTIEGWYVGMDAPSPWLYLPETHWRAGIVYHHLPLPSGNLELYARLEHLFRGRMQVPAPAGGGAPFREVSAYRATNFELTIRVVSVRAFLRWDNLFHRLGQADLVDYPLPGQRIVWGVKWEFWN